jgi:hypothetical protein
MKTFERPLPYGYSRRRLSIEALARYHRAAVGNGLSAAERLVARSLVRLEELEDLAFGPTFLATLALNRPALDLYEENSCIERINA